MKSYPVKENPISSAVSKILRYKQTDRQTHMLLLYYNDNLGLQHPGGCGRTPDLGEANGTNNGSRWGCCIRFEICARP